MTDRKELENYEAAEGKEIVRLLKKMEQPDPERAPSSFQTKVQARLEDKRGHRQWHPWALGYRVPLAFAAGLVLGFGLPVFFPATEIGKPALDETVFRGGNTQSASTDKYQSPEEWLEYIAELLVTGRVNKAHQQITAFRQRHPNYEHNSANP